MRKFTLLTFLTLLFSVAMTAQNKQRVLSPEKMAALVPNAKAEAKNVPATKNLQKTVDLQRLKSAREVFAARGKGDHLTFDKQNLNRAPKALGTDVPYISTSQREHRCSTAGAARLISFISSMCCRHLSLVAWAMWYSVQTMRYISKTSSVNLQLILG